MIKKFILIILILLICSACAPSICVVEDMNEALIIVNVEIKDTNEWGHPYVYSIQKEGLWGMDRLIIYSAKDYGWEPGDVIEFRKVEE